jgi:DNA-binding NtrC family response regulator
MAKIIIIDDEPAMVEVIVTLCREKGHQVFPFSSAAKAVEQMETIEPEIVITDVKMETMSGFDVLRHVKENHKQTLVILITAYASVDTAIEAMKMGAHGYVPKPFKIDELQMTVQRALEFQSARQKAAPARSWSRAGCILTATGSIIPSSPSTAAPCRRTCSSRSCSDTKRAPSPGQWRTSAGSSKKPISVQFSSMR